MLIPAESRARQLPPTADLEPVSRAAHVDLKALGGCSSDNRDELIAAINRDYGKPPSSRPCSLNSFVVQDGIRDTIKHPKRWMKPSKRHVDAMVHPLAKNRLIPQPLAWSA